MLTATRATPERAGDLDPCWPVLLSRDLRYDGACVFAVRSTGMYCRAACPVRRPRSSATLRSWYPFKQVVDVEVLEHHRHAYLVEVRLQLDDEADCGGADHDWNIPGLPIHLQHLQELPALLLGIDDQVEDKQLRMRLLDLVLQQTGLDCEAFGRYALAELAQQFDEEVEDLRAGS